MRTPSADKWVSHCLKDTLPKRQATHIPNLSFPYHIRPILSEGYTRSSSLIALFTTISRPAITKPNTTHKTLDHKLIAIDLLIELHVEQLAIWKVAVGRGSVLVRVGAAIGGGDAGRLAGDAVREGKGRDCEVQDLTW